MAKKFHTNIDLNRNSLVNAILHPVTSDPSSPVDGQIWYRSDTDRVMVRANGSTVTLATLADVTAGAITGALWDANSVIVAVSDDTPVAQVIGEGEVLGRASGGDIGALTAAQLRTILNVENGATADQSAAEILTALQGVDGTGSGLDADTVDGVEAAALATITYVDTEIASAVGGLVDSAPGTLDTLNELAAALGDDANFSSTVTTALASKATKFADDIGDNSTTAIAVTHNLGTTDVVVSLKEVSTGELVEADVVVTSSNVVTITFGIAPTTDSIRVVVIG